MTDNGIESSLTRNELWQHGRAEVQIWMLLNNACTNMIVRGLTGKFWACAIFYAADIPNIQYRADLKMSPHESLYGTKQDVNKCQPIRYRMLHLREGRSESEQKVLCTWGGCHILLGIYHGQHIKLCPVFTWSP